VRYFHDFVVNEVCEAVERRLNSFQILRKGYADKSAELFIVLAIQNASNVV
jgi:hypothetical protein